jgi:hypothetical protein
MKRVKLLAFAAMALFAFGAVSSTALASTTPELLCTGAGCVAALKVKMTGGKGSLSTLGGVTLTGETVAATLENCKNIGSDTENTNLCSPVLLTFTGVKKGEATCKSEMANKEEKDAAGTVLVAVDIHMATEETLPGKVLEALALFKVLGALPSEAGEELTINCAGVITKVKGTLPCLATPGLTSIGTTGTLTITCTQNATSHDQETGMCEQLCEELTSAPFEAKLGEKFEDAGMNITSSGSPNETIFLDD